MDRNEFRDVFLAWVRDDDKIAMLSDLGIGHYNSPWARTLQIAMTVMEPLQARLTALDAQVSALAQAVAALSAPTPTPIPTPIPTPAPTPLVAVAHEELEAALTPPKKRGRPKKKADAVEAVNG